MRQLLRRNTLFFEIMKSMALPTLVEPGTGFFDRVAIGNAVDGDHAADCARKKGGHDARPRETAKGADAAVLLERDPGRLDSVGAGRRGYTLDFDAPSGLQSAQRAFEKYHAAAEVDRYTAQHKGLA